MSHLEPCPLCKLGTGPRQLLQLLLDYVASDKPTPSQARLAVLLNVERRTIQRWTRELRDSAYVRTNPRKVGILPTPKIWRSGDSQDRQISQTGDSQDRQIARSSDRQISQTGDSQDRQISQTGDSQDRQIARSQTPEFRNQKHPINESGDSQDRQILPGGGGDHHDPLGDSPSNTKPIGPKKKAQPCETRLGRYMAANGFGAAREFDRPELDSNHWIHYIRLQLESGTSKDRIVHMLRLGAPLEWNAPVLVSVELDQVEELAPVRSVTAPPIEELQKRWDAKQGKKR